MKRTITITAFALATLIFLSFVPIFGTAAENDISFIRSEGAIPYDVSSPPPQNAARCMCVITSDGATVYEHNADEKRGMASTTKIMTALVAIENASPDEEFVIPAEAVGIEGSSVYLKEGERLTLRELLFCLMLESGNDSATAIALAIGGSVNGFVDMMNSRAREMGLTDTSFANPHGLSDNDHYTTARELAMITAEALKHPLFRELVSTKRISVRYDGAENGRSLVNHNKLLFGYSGAIGVKTGYTKRDGKCLVSAAERNGTVIIAVTLQDPFPTATHRALLDSAFAVCEQKTVAQEGEIVATVKIANADGLYITLTNSEKVTLSLSKGARTEITLNLPKSLNAPIEKGASYGYATVSANGKEVYIIHLKATSSIKAKRKSLVDLLF